MVPRLPEESEQHPIFQQIPCNTFFPCLPSLLRQDTDLPDILSLHYAKVVGAKVGRSRKPSLSSHVSLEKPFLSTHFVKARK